MRTVAFAAFALLFLLANGVASGQDRGTPLPAPNETPGGHSLRLPTWLGGTPKPQPPPRVLPPPAPVESSEPPITISGNLLQSRREDAATVQMLFGSVEITQGEASWTGRRVVVWNFTGASGGRVEFVFDDQATQTTAAGNRPAQGKLFVLTTNRPAVVTSELKSAEIAADDPVLKRLSKIRAIAPARRTAAQLPRPNEIAPGVPLRSVQSPFPAPPMLPTPGGAIGGPFGPAPFSGSANGFGPVMGPQQRISITPRSFEVPFVLESRPNPGSMPAEQIITVTRGVNIVIERPATGEVLDLTADSAVIWTAAAAGGGGGGLGFDLNITPDTSFQVYLRGNIVLRTGGTIARAREAFFDRAEGRGLLLKTEVRQLVPVLRGDLRVNAEAVRFEITNPNLAGLGPNDLNLWASNAWVSASQFGEPTYRLESSEVILDNRPTGRAINPATGQVQPVSQPWITTRDNRFLLGNVPLLATRELQFPAEEFTIPIRRLNVTADRTFGVQFLTMVSLDDLFDLNLPPGTRLDLEANYLTDRGPQIGPEWDYRFRHDAFGYDALSYGFGDTSFIWDDGEDRLGLGRRELNAPDQVRGFVNIKHRTLFPDGWSATAELGVVSDRNVLEQYEEQVFDNGKDLDTLLEIKNVTGNTSAAILVQPTPDTEFNNTEWLPRGDLTILGQPVFETPLLWSSHSMAGYGSINQTNNLPFSPLELAQNPAEVLSPLGYFPEVSGLVAMTRHELALPFDIGPAHLAPYVTGEILRQEESIDGSGLTRFYGVAGIRGATSLTRIDRSVQSDIFGLNGLAHKMTFDFDYSIAESTERLDDVAQYNDFDDNAQERFRERLEILTFGGVLPPIADPRGYALRAGAGRSVTAPHYELVDDQHVVRLGWRHRWQTKAGPPQAQRVRDWMTLDLEASIFPGADDFTAEDNFGETLGLLSARYAWNVGERTTLLADGIYDPFENGQETWSVGVLSQRSQRGSIYVGYRSIAIDSLDSDIVTVAASYAMSKKWIAVASTSHDFAQDQGRGQTLQLTRLGRDFLFTYGVRYDASKNDFGIQFQLEPLIGPRDGREVAPLLNRRPTQFGPLR